MFAASLLLPALAQPSPLHAEIAVRVYHTGSVPPGARHAALQVATETLAVAGVAVSWRECETGCDDAPRPDELVVRLVQVIGQSSRADRLVLGDAYVDATTGRGVLATIYLDRVQEMAEKSGTDVATLLGRAIAHELGHLLLATNTHSSRGLMRANWSRNDLRRERPVDWMFTETDARTMRKRLQ